MKNGTRGRGGAVPTCCYTSVNAAYLPNARILANSVKRFHPEWVFILLFNDFTPRSVNWQDEPFDQVVFSHWLPTPNFRRWAFDYDVVEFCTATKGVMAEYIFDALGFDRTVYLDPDCVVFSPLDELDRLFEDNDLILTPHITDPETDDLGIVSHEVAALKHGTFNLGFYAIANRLAGRAYLRWWAQRLLTFSHIDFAAGTFTDQKWANLAPYMFDRVAVYTNRAYNTATWNMKGRKLRRECQTWIINDQPLRFYHFSGFGHDFSWADREIATFAAENTAVKDLWAWYKDTYRANRLIEEPKWHWGHFTNGTPITANDRLTYRTEPELQQNFPDPFSIGAHDAIRTKQRK